MLPDFRVRQRDYLLEISRALTQELDQEKLLARILKISIEMLAGQAGLIALKEQDGWRVVTAHGIASISMEIFKIRARSFSWSSSWVSAREISSR